MSIMSSADERILIKCELFIEELASIKFRHENCPSLHHQLQQADLLCNLLENNISTLKDRTNKNG